MNPFNKIFLIVAMVLAVGTGVAIAAGTNGGSSSDPAATVVDVKGPCDEAEHANDPECAGAQVPEDNDANEQGDDRGRGRDHAEDNAAEVEDQNDDHGQGADDQGENDDNQGQNDDQGENAQDDDSGPSANSGPGSSHDSGDDDSGDDDSGHGGHSGHGGGDDD